MKALILILILTPNLVLAQTPKLNIRLEHNSSDEFIRRAQIERLAAKYDLKKYTVTRDIVIDQFAINHSGPVLTLNLRRFINNDDRALSVYLHEQAHRLLMERYRDRGITHQMLPALKRMYPNLEPPPGDNEGTAYMHLVVFMLEWQALEDVIGVKRARAVFDFMRQNNYKALVKTVMDNREQMEKFLTKYDVKW